jgi:hypothetical protein
MEVGIKHKTAVGDVCWQTNSSSCSWTAVSTAWRPARELSRRTTRFALTRRNCLGTGTPNATRSSGLCPSCEYNLEPRLDWRGTQRPTSFCMPHYISWGRCSSIATRLITVHWFIKDSSVCFVKCSPHGDVFQIEVVHLNEIHASWWVQYVRTVNCIWEKGIRLDWSFSYKLIEPTGTKTEISVKMFKSISSTLNVIYIPI